jgi:hypothetical protein
MTAENRVTFEQLKAERSPAKGATAKAESKRFERAWTLYQPTSVGWYRVLEKYVLFEKSDPPRSQPVEVAVSGPRSLLHSTLLINQARTEVWRVQLA